MRIEVHYRDSSVDGRAHRLSRDLAEAHIGGVAGIAVCDVYVVEGIPGLEYDRAAAVFTDPVAQTTSMFMHGSGRLADWRYLVEIHYRAGVTDPVAITARKALEDVTGAPIPAGALVQTARQYLFAGKELDDARAGEIASALHNPLIESAVVISRAQWESGIRPPERYPQSVKPSDIRVEAFDIAAMDDDALIGFSRKRLLALSLDEMRAVKGYFTDPPVIREREAAGLPAGATDVELEMIAQTWSEHCKHKILNARVRYTEGGKTETIDSLFKTYIRATTEALAGSKPFLRSVFHDNSGVVEFDEERLLCFKVETHNSPSALDPYGGAITGIVGVNRDILGTGKGARPIFNTNVLCFGYRDTPKDKVPAGLLHPRRVLAGVHRGIVDGGNQSGIPVVGGAFLFDESYLGKPLVFCGTGGILPAEIGGEGGWINHVDPGDLAVMVGGRIGKDGIHGATFSSLVLDEESPTSAVQIGDPITQKKMSDFLMEARDAELYRGITDNGAGGLSSSLGEMSEKSGGIRIDLEKCPLKYQGLAPWEILVSESQERMSLAVSPDRLDAFMALAARRDVEATVIGTFTDSGYIEVFNGGEPVARISEAFLHDGLPVMELEAEWPARERPSEPVPRTDAKDLLLAVLADPNVRSKEELVRQYDHEVQAGSVVKPFTGIMADGPSDGAVFRPAYDSSRGVTVTHGICPRYGDDDTYRMAACAVDEAFRAHIACGGDPDLASALDNFCWPDPVQSAATPDGKYKLAQLVRACRGLQDACLAYGLPLISGKDSMKNDARIGGEKISVRPTLLVSLMGIIGDISKAVTTDFKGPGNPVYLIGETRRELGGSTLERVTGTVLGAAPAPDFGTALACYRAYHGCAEAGIVRSCHDLSDGGLAVAAAESAIGGRIGADIDLDAVPGTLEAPVEILFSESPSRLLVTIAPGDAERFERAFTGLPCSRIGRTTDTPVLRFTAAGAPVLAAGMDEMLAAWKGGTEGSR